MIVLAADQICKYYGAELVLDNISLQVKQGQKVALLGANGSGKTTLLNILAGRLEADGGQVIRQKGARLGYQTQEFKVVPGHTVLSEGLAVFAHLEAMEKELRALEQVITDRPNDQQSLKKYSGLSQRFEEAGGYQYPARTRSILRGLGFLETEFDQPVEQLSGGQQSRLSLAKLLLSDPDILLLDEPTNHLDIDAIQWLEDHLRNYSGGLLMITHDRRFLEALADEIYELNHQHLERYPGNYHFFQRERASRRKQQAKEYQKQQEYIHRTEDFIARNIAGQKTKLAQSRRKELAKLERLAPPPGENFKAAFSFRQKRTSGRHVLQVENLAKAWSEKPVFKNISFQLERGERAGLIGPNGCGKTTLLEVICGHIAADSGQVRLGHHADIAYFSQKRTDLNPENTAADEIWACRPTWTRGQVQSLLARFLFRGEEAFKPVRVMSGGEAGRLALAKLFLEEANFLVLDEPTNHLDIDSKEVLEDALDQYPGTVLVVSHDRWFLDRVTNITLAMSNDGVSRYLGNYQYYLEKKRAQEEQAARPQAAPAAAPKAERKRSGLSPNERFRRQKRLEELETEIATAEERQEELHQQIEEASADHQLLADLTAQLHALSQQLEDLYEQWTQVSEELSEN
ncbi:MAG: ABC-F family ATP-binding cassette domain-containing protein [Firmicutes bacterium]|nr:ABC-F family ATP-binding cassette domain-containing protein [Bacillota bacterium]